MLGSGFVLMEHSIKPGQIWGLGQRTDEDIWIYLVVEIEHEHVHFATLSKETGIKRPVGSITTDRIDSVLQKNSLWHRIL